MSKALISEEQLPASTFVAQHSLISETLEDWQFCKHLANTLTHVRGNTVSEAGGVKSYLQGRDGLSNSEIKIIKGNVAEQHRNFEESGSRMEPDPRHEYIDRVHGEVTIQDYAGKSLDALAEKIDSDGNADRIQITDELYEEMSDHVESGDQYASLFQKNLFRIVPDSEYTHNRTSAEYYEQKTEEGESRILHPIENAFQDIGEQELVALVSISLISLAGDIASTGTLNSSNINRLIERTPSILFRYTIIAGSSLCVTEMLANNVEWVAENTDIVVPGIGFLLSTAWNGIRFINGDISGRQFNRSFKVSAGGAVAAFGTKMAIMYFFDPTGGVVATCVIGVSMVYAACVGYFTSKQAEKIRFEGIKRTLNYLEKTLSIDLMPAYYIGPITSDL